MGVALEILGFSDEVVLGSIVGLLALGAGSWLVYTGVMNLGRGWNILTHDPVPAGEVHLADSTVEVQGEARPLEAAATAPYSGAKAVAYTYKKKRKEKERRHNNDGRTETKWRTIDSGTVRKPFLVVDDSGEVAVDPDGANLSVNEGVVDRHINIKEIEGRVDVGETVHVYGQKCDGGTGDAPGDESVYVGAGDDPDAFSIADTSENWTILRYLTAGAFTLLLGIVLVLAVAVMVLAYSAGGLEHVSLPFVDQYLS